MRVTSSVKVSITGSQADRSRKAAIERQIRQLEEKREEYLEELAKLGKGMEEAANAEQSSVEGATIDTPGGGSTSSEGAQMVAPTASGSSQSATPKMSVPQSSPKDVQRRQMLSSVLGGKKSKKQKSESDSSEFKVNRSAKELMKLIQMTEIQIATLMQQLGDDASLELSMTDDEDEEEGGDGDAAASSSTSAPAPLPSVTVTEGGESAEIHVDGYA